MEKTFGHGGILVSTNKVNWEDFFGNSSTTEAVILFALGKFTFKKFAEECWPKECKIAIRVLKQRGYVKARRAAKHALNQRGYTHKEYSAEYNDWEKW